MCTPCDTLRQAFHLHNPIYYKKEILWWIFLLHFSNVETELQRG